VARAPLTCAGGQQPDCPDRQRQDEPCFAEAVPERASTVYHVCCSLAGRPAYGCPTVALCSGDASGGGGKGALPKILMLKSLPAPRQTICFCGIIRAGRPCLAGNARGGCVPVAGGPTGDRALLKARLYLFALHQLQPELSQRGQCICRDAYDYILLERKGLLFCPSSI